MLERVQLDQGHCIKHQTKIVNIYLEKLVKFGFLNMLLNQEVLLQDSIYFGSIYYLIVYTLNSSLKKHQFRQVTQKRHLQ